DLIEQFPIKLCMCVDAAVDREFLCDASPARGAQALPEPRIACEFQDRSADRRWVARRHHQPSLAIDHCLGVTADIGDDHGESSRHSLQDEIGESFVLTRGQQTKISRSEESRYVGVLA